MNSADFHREMAEDEFRPCPAHQQYLARLRAHPDPRDPDHPGLPEEYECDTPTS